MLVLKHYLNEVVVMQALTCQCIVSLILAALAVTVLAHLLAAAATATNCASEVSRNAEVPKCQKDKAWKRGRGWW